MPDHEEDRLKELRRYAILDSPAGGGLTASPRLAARLFKVPVA